MAILNRGLPTSWKSHYSVCPAERMDLPFTTITLSSKPPVGTRSWWMRLWWGHNVVMMLQVWPVILGIWARKTGHLTWSPDSSSSAYKQCSGTYSNSDFTCGRCSSSAHKLVASIQEGSSFKEMLNLQILGHNFDGWPKIDFQWRFMFVPPLHFVLHPSDDILVQYWHSSTSLSNPCLSRLFPKWAHSWLLLWVGLGTLHPLIT